MVGKLQQLNNKYPDILKQCEPDIFKELCIGRGEKKKKIKTKQSAGLKRHSFSCGVVEVEGFKPHAFKTEIHF